MKPGVLPILAGLVFGLISWPIGLFVGLQISPLVANIILFPVIVVSELSETPLGNMEGPMIALALCAACVYWAAVFSVVASMVRKGRRRQGE